MIPKEYRQAEARLKESIKLRCDGLPGHSYPRREEDLETMRHHHAEHGIPEPSLWMRVWRYLTRGR